MNEAAIEKNRKSVWIQLIIVLVSVLLLLFTAPPEIVSADGEPRRLEIIEAEIPEYEWWLVHWQDNSLACILNVEHAGEPTGLEVYNQCGEKLYNIWMISEPCSALSNDDTSSCKGLYFFKAGSHQKKKQITVELPLPRVWVELRGCIPIRSEDLCVDIPTLVITAAEPLPNERITGIQGTLNGIPYVCAGDICELPLKDTGEDGIAVEFWADSSYGDSSQQYKGRIRVAESIDELTQTTGWRVDIVSEKEDFNTLKGCARIWQSFPKLGSEPDWLSSPVHPYLLETDEPYTYLAGQLILRGYVDTSRCENFGLLENGYASQCGLEQARPIVNVWQNAFDEHFVKVADEKGLPSQLLKRIYAKESQFWPETYKLDYYEYGPGHINELGADTALLWNENFYDQFCPLVLLEKTCAPGYALLADEDQVLLRGALLAEIEIDLPPRGNLVDPDQAATSVSLFAETLLGNCSQVRQMIINETDLLPGEVMGYEELWKMTLANYHAGPGCLAEAIEESVTDQEISWQRVSEALLATCPYAIDYIDDIVD